MSKVKRTIEAFDRAQLIMLAILLPICLITLFFVVVLLVPWKPVEVYGSEILPRTACPREEVEVYKDWEIKQPVRQIAIEYFWTHPDSPAETYGGTAYLEDVEAQSRRVERSPIARVAPRAPGKWQLVTRYTVYGSQFGVPQRQDFNIDAAGTITVLPEEECK